jgi:transcriptional repressor NrdR
MECSRRFTTYERMEETPLRVVKKEGSRVPFDRSQILRGMLKACEKRPVSMEDLEKITSSIERRLTEMFDREVGSKYIGQLVMEELKKLDQVAYVRFASVYREFKDVEQFIFELKPFLEKKGGA